MDYSDYRKIANAYYNLGLEKARESDLTGAAACLKRALRYDKTQIEARNLLGLIYYETGETAEALVQWVISTNYDSSRHNRADYYLDEVQRKPQQLEKASSSIKKFNQALYQAQNAGEDFAIVELTHILKDNPNFVKANILLALLYMQQGDNLKAGNALMRVLKLDRGNAKALYLMDEVKQHTGKAEVEEKKMKNAFSHRMMTDDDVILPKVKKQITPDQMVIFLTIGLIIGLISFYMLILPGMRKNYIKDANERLAANSQELSELNARYTELQEKYSALEAGYSDVYGKMTALEDQNTGFAAYYQKLSNIITCYQSGAYVAAAKDYVTIDRDGITEEPLTTLLAEVDRYMQTDVFDRIVTMGTTTWNTLDLKQAEEYFDLALAIKPDDPMAMYLKARLIQSQDRDTEANAIFDKIVGEHPDSVYAERSKEARGY